MRPSNRAFTCQRCGHCCEGSGGIVLSRQDALRLAEHLGLSPGEFLSRHALSKGGKQHLKTGADGYCEFFAQGCGVHAARPDICRAWPYFKGNLIDSSSWELAQDYCPGLNPESGHREFVNQGLEYLQAEDLLGDSPDRAEALRLIPRDILAGSKTR